MELAGFTSAKRRSQLTVGASVTLNQTLQLGGVAETVTVTAGSPLVETSRHVRTTTVDIRRSRTCRSTAAASRTSSR